MSTMLSGTQNHAFEHKPSRVVVTTLAGNTAISELVVSSQLCLVASHLREARKAMMRSQGFELRIILRSVS